MEIILNEQDLEKLIKDNYSGVTNIKFSVKKLKVTLQTNGDIFKKDRKPIQVATPVKNTEPQEEVLPMEARLGVMIPGGSDRSIQHIG